MLAASLKLIVTLDWGLMQPFAGLTSIMLSLVAFIWVTQRITLKIVACEGCLLVMVSSP